MKPTISAKYCGRAYSTISSSSLSSSITRRLEMKKSLGLLAAFIGGYTAHAYKKFRENNEYWGRVDRMYKDYRKRKEELNQRLSRILEREGETGGS